MHGHQEVGRYRTTGESEYFIVFRQRSTQVSILKPTAGPKTLVPVATQKDSRSTATGSIHIVDTEAQSIYCKIPMMLPPRQQGTDDKHDY